MVQRSYGIYLSMLSIHPSIYQVHESNWAQQFHTAKFKALSDQGATLQNIVYCAPCALHAHCMHSACILHTHCLRTAHAHAHACVCTASPSHLP